MESMDSAKPLTLLLIAGHHNADNIAAQRFRGLLQYMDPARIRTVVFTRGGPLSSTPSRAAETIEVAGTPSSSKVSKGYLIALMHQTLTPWLPTPPGLPADGWGRAATQAAEEVIDRERNAGRECIVLGSFCPLDAIVAATTAARRKHAPLVLDFRDGLGFEPFGNQTAAGMAAKRLLESSMCRRAQALLTVSTPLVDYLQARFPQTPVTLLANGFDPQEIATRDGHIEAVVSRYKRRMDDERSVLLGHFGRLSRSDPRSVFALDRLVRSIAALAPTLRQRLHLLFMGDLDGEDIARIERLQCRVSILRPRAKPWALALMRQCNALLLLTSDRRSVATGKLFDYLGVGSKVLHLTMTENEASRILRHSGIAHHSINLAEAQMNSDQWASFLALAPEEPKHLDTYSKPAQAKLLEQLIVRLGKDSQP